MKYEMTKKEWNKVAKKYLKELIEMIDNKEINIKNIKVNCETKKVIENNYEYHQLTGKTTIKIIYINKKYANQ